MEDSVGRPNDPGRRALLVLALVSGLGGVVYEVLYMRHLSTVLGDMFYVHAALLAMFLLGNGVGAWIAHRFVRWLFAFELVIGVYAMTLPFLLDGYEVSFVARLVPSPVGQTLLSSAILLAVPAVAIGISIPLFSEYVRARGESGHAFKAVYFLYNLGAAISILVVDFFLIRRVGYGAALFLVGSANLGCGTVLLLRRRAWTPPAAARPVRSADGIPLRHLWALLLASTAAAVFLSFFIKVCYHLFLPQRENFAVCTSVSVLCIAAGTAMVRRWRIGFPALLAAAMLSMMLIYAMLGSVVELFHWVEDVASRSGPQGLVEPAWVGVPKELLFGFLLAVPYVFLGATIPALLHREGDVARRSGSLLLISGIGNAVGLLSFMFVLHPWLRIFSIVPVIWAALMGALVVFGSAALRSRQWAAIGLSALLLPLVYSKPEAGVYLLHDEIPAGASVSHYKSVSDNVSYVATEQRSWIKFNGQPSIFITGQPVEPRSAGRSNLSEAVSGVIPALVAPRRERALVLGLGSGMTAGAAGTLFDHTDIVEINAAFFPLVASIGHINFDVTRNPRAAILHDDARRFLATTDETYDAIVNSVPSPTYFAAGKIYTAEFLDMVKGALRPGGVYSGWFTPGDMSTEGVHTLLATLADRFEYCNLAILRRSYYFTSCSDTPLTVNTEIEFPDWVADTLGGVRGVTAAEYFASIVVSDDIFEHLKLRDTQLNTDDFPILEFQVMRLGRRELSMDPIERDPGRFNINVRDENGTDELLMRAIVLAQIDLPLFRRVYAPYLTRHEALGAAYNARMQQLIADAAGNGPAPGGDAGDGGS